MPNNEPTRALNRRDFLQVAGTGLALGELTPGLLHGTAPAPSEFAVKMDAGAIVSLERTGIVVDPPVNGAGAAVRVEIGV